MKTEPRVALTVVGPSGVYAPMLAASVVYLALIDIWPQVSRVVSVISIETGEAVSVIISVT